MGDQLQPLRSRRWLLTREGPQWVDSGNSEAKRRTTALADNPPPIGTEQIFPGLRIGRRAGCVRVGSRLVDDRLHARIPVSDNEPGLVDRVLGQLSLSFSTTRPFGTGLGLPSSRRVIHHMGGVVLSGNRSEGGAEFVTRLP
ncbi:hypothetical protein E6C76_08590 [Pseudothauera nasutitermitis]|uniref:histidine kinase n=1 Tax=Pseudothauera nasutitermitis TaxID=2565930 RepID=A0A4S4AZK8_9RHOO|nr:ATP-binding protein [Pseudothauera nasutitermitis]THF65619.1 hypothetical protein E6C76_08590 [Pseudothauera nasutitermitis]